MKQSTIQYVARITAIVEPRLARLEPEPQDIIIYKELVRAACTLFVNQPEMDAPIDTSRDY